MFAEHEQVTLLDACRSQCAQASGWTLLAKAKAAMLGSDDLLMDKPAAAVIAAKDCSYDSGADRSDEAQAQISAQEAADAMRLISVAELKP